MHPSVKLLVASPTISWLEMALCVPNSHSGLASLLASTVKL